MIGFRNKSYTHVLASFLSPSHVLRVFGHSAFGKCDEPSTSSLRVRHWNHSITRDSSFEKTLDSGLEVWNRSREDRKREELLLDVFLLSQFLLSEFTHDLMAETRESTESEFFDGIRESMPTFAKELVAGGVAGGFAKTAVAPLEIIKILFQTRRADFQRIGLFGSFKKIALTEGIRGFYRGNGASVARIVPYAALHYMTYEQYRRWIILSFPDVQRGPVLDLMAGSFAGGTAVLFTYPLDLVRTKLAYQVFSSGIHTRGLCHTEAIYKGILDCLIKIYRQSNLRGLYCGADICSERHRKGVTANLICGSISGLLGQTITYPLDVVRETNAGSNFSSSKQGEMKGTTETLLWIAREQGWKQLFSGLSINYIRVVPSVGIGFTVYDFMKSWLRVPSREKCTDVGEGTESRSSSLPSS